VGRELNVAHQNSASHDLLNETLFFKIFKIAVEGRNGDIKNFSILIDIYLADFTEPVNDSFFSLKGVHGGFDQIFC
jgi:hypothetical protein